MKCFAEGLAGSEGSVSCERPAPLLRFGEWRGPGDEESDNDEGPASFVAIEWPSLTGDKSIASCRRLSGFGGDFLSLLILLLTGMPSGTDSISGMCLLLRELLLVGTGAVAAVVVVAVVCVCPATALVPGWLAGTGTPLSPLPLR